MLWGFVTPFSFEKVVILQKILVNESSRCAAGRKLFFIGRLCVADFIKNLLHRGEFGANYRIFFTNFVKYLLTYFFFGVKIIIVLKGYEGGLRGVLLQFIKRTLLNG